MEIYRVTDRLEHILEATAAIRTYTEGMGLEDYKRNRMVIDAVERNLERLSEASRHIPEDMTRRYAEIPWRRIADFGNVLRHAYDHIAVERVWQIITENLAPLEAASKTMLRELKGEA